MTDIARVLDRYTMTLEPHEPGTDEWFQDWVLRSPKQAGHHLTAGWHAYASLLDIYSPADIFSATEFFGGLGVQALVIQDLFKPVDHVVLEYAREGVDHMRRVLPGHVDVRQRDSYRPESFVAADLYGVDFGDLTCWKTREGEQHRVLLDRIFATDPKAVVFTDIACRYLHLHRERYESLLGPGTCASYPQYLQALLARLQALYGYRLHRGYWDRWSTVMALVPDYVEGRPLLFETPDQPVGLELF